MTSDKIELPGGIAAAQGARRFIENCLWRATEDVLAISLLLVSEVVTNAVLHVDGPITVELRQEERAHRIIVSDRSWAPLIEKGYQAQDTTGRGLQLLDSLAAAWGWLRTSTGKAVWFDLPVPLEDGPLPPRSERQLQDDPYPDGKPIALIGAPIAAMIRTAAHYDDLYREFRLISELDTSQVNAIPERLLELIDELGRSFLGFGRTAGNAWEEAVREGRRTVDLYFRLPPELGPAIAQYDQLLDEADEFCQQAEVLTIAPTEEALRVRRWAFGQAVCQCRGEPPTPWSRTSP